MKIKKEEGSLIEKISFFIIWVTIFILAAAVVLFAHRVNIWDFNVRVDSSKLSQFGDFVGGTLGSIWALVGVLLFYVALKEQRRDFREQRNEQVENRKLFRLQQSTLEAQKFEQTFFNLLNLHHVIVGSIDLRKERRVKKSYRPEEVDKWVETGRDCFFSFYKGLKNIYNNMSKNDKSLDVAGKAYDRYYQKHHSDLDSYIRNVKSILDFLLLNRDNVDIGFYKSHFLAQLSTYEVIVLFYSLASEKSSGYKSHVEIDFFREINKDLLFHSSHFITD